MLNITYHSPRRFLKLSIGLSNRGEDKIFEGRGRRKEGRVEELLETVVEEAIVKLERRCANYGVEEGEWRRAANKSKRAKERESERANERKLVGWDENAENGVEDENGSGGGVEGQALFIPHRG
ncbi:MAG: hypothetical protein M1827_006576 [Pycnora praestabilis]|nr:MAG: hypothetical protein M1827_006576 [Pycnora praestabilis]